MRGPVETSTPIVIESRGHQPHDPKLVAKLEGRVSDLVKYFNFLLWNNFKMSIKSVIFHNFQELLNQECMSIIRGLQRDVEERSKKILKLELAGNKAKVVTHNERPVFIETGEPRIEMSALIRGKLRPVSESGTSSSTQGMTKSSELDMVGEVIQNQ